MNAVMGECSLKLGGVCVGRTGKLVLLTKRFREKVGDDKNIYIYIYISAGYVFMRWYKYVRGVLREQLCTN